MFGFVNKQELDIVVANISEMYTAQQEINANDKNEVARITSYLSTTQNNVNALNESLKLLNARLDKTDAKLEDFRKIVIQMGKIINAVAIEKKVIEAPKPKTAEEELKESLEQLEETPKVPEQKCSIYCIVCNEETDTSGAEVKQTNSGKMIVGKCTKCGSSKNKTVK